MEVWEFLSIFGKFELWLVVSITLFFIPLINRRYRKRYYWLTLILPSLLLASTITFILKETFKIPRPCNELPGCPDGYSFPSGHSTVIFSVITIVILNRRKKESLPLISLLLLLATLVSVSRIILNHHTITDVISGGLIGIFSGVFIDRLYLKFKKRKWGDRDLNPGLRLPKPGS